MPLRYLKQHAPNEAATCMFPRSLWSHPLMSGSQLMFSALYRPVNFFHTKLGKRFLYGLCAQRHRHAETEKRAKHKMLETHVPNASCARMFDMYCICPQCIYIFICCQIKTNIGFNNAAAAHFKMVHIKALCLNGITPGPASPASLSFLLQFEKTLFPWRSINFSLSSPLLGRVCPGKIYQQLMLKATHPLGSQSYVNLSTVMRWPCPLEDRLS